MKAVATPARVHPALSEQGKQGSPTDESQGQPGSVQVTTEIRCGETDPRSSCEVNPLIRFKFNENNECQTQHGDCQAGLLLPSLSFIDKRKA